MVCLSRSVDGDHFVLAGHCWRCARYGELVDSVVFRDERHFDGWLQLDVVAEPADFWRRRARHLGDKFQRSLLFNCLRSTDYTYSTYTVTSTTENAFSIVSIMSIVCCKSNPAI